MLHNHSARRETKPRRSRRGLTLVEVMIAVAIMSTVTAVVYGAFAQTLKNKDRVEGAADEMQAVTNTLERMSRELSSAYVSAHVNPSPSLQKMQTLFVGTDHGSRDRVDFTSFSHLRLYRDAHESDACEISYFITRDPNDSSRRVLARREQARPDEDATRGGDVQIALDNVEEFDVEFLDPLTLEWMSAWDTTQSTGQPNRLPAQVKITIKIKPRAGGSLVTYGTRVVPQIRWGLNFALYNP